MALQEAREADGARGLDARRHQKVACHHVHRLVRMNDTMVARASLQGHA